MIDQSPESLSDIEILDILQSMKDDELDTEAKEIIRNGGKAGRQEAHKAALVALNQSFESKFGSYPAIAAAKFECFVQMPAH